MEDCLAATDFFAGLSWPDRLAIDFNEKSVQGNKTQAARRCKEDSLLWLLMPYHNYKMDRGKALSVRGGGSSQIQKNPPHIFPLDFVIACLQQRSMYANVD